MTGSSAPVISESLLSTSGSKDSRVTFSGIISQDTFAEYLDQSVLDLSGNVPFLVHMKIKQSSNLAHSAATLDHQPLTFLLTGSMFDLPSAVGRGTVKLIDITDHKAPITVDMVGDDVLEASDHLPEPWVIVQDPKMTLSETQSSDQGASGVTFPVSSLITLPTTRDGTAGKKYAVITTNMTDTLHPLVSPGRKYKLVFPANPGDMNVHWWGWTDRENILHDISHNRDASSSNIPKELVALADLPGPSLASRRRKLTFSQLHTGAILFRVVERLPIPPVLQVNFSLRHNPAFALRDGEGYDEGRGEKYYTLCATTTYPLPPVTSSATSAHPPPGPITVQLWGPQAHLTRPRSRNTISNPDNIKPRPVFPDVSAPIFGMLPSLLNLCIIDTLTGEDLVHDPRQTHPQDTPLRPDTQFLTLRPGESVTRDVARLPYPDRNRRRPPVPGEPGYYASRVRDMQAGRRYRITLRDGGSGGGENKDEGGAKGFWWHEGTKEEFFAGVWDGLEGEAEGSRKKTAAVRRRVFDNLQLPLHAESEDEVIVECPATAGWRDEEDE